jgi:hypothetical protein
MARRQALTLEEITNLVNASDSELSDLEDEDEEIEEVGQKKFPVILEDIDVSDIPLNDLLDYDNLENYEEESNVEFDIY